MELTNGSTGTLTTTVSLNGLEAERNVLWESSNPEVVTINIGGQYQVVGDSGTSATITAILDGNTNIVSFITIQVVDEKVVQPLVTINPTFNKIRQYESITFSVEAVYGSVVVVPETIQISLAQGSQVLSNQYLTITQSGSQYIITANAIAPDPQILYVTVQSNSPSFQTIQQFTLNVVSMLG